MQVRPDAGAFVAGYDAGRPQAVWATLAADLDIPVSTYLKLADGERCSFLLESVERGEARGRYSILGIRPDVVWRCFGTAPRSPAVMVRRRRPISVLPPSPRYVRAVP